MKTIDKGTLSSQCENAKEGIFLLNFSYIYISYLCKKY